MTPVQQLRALRTELERSGWCQHSTVDREGRRCLVGAMVAADLRWIGVALPLMEAAHSSSLVEWNDTPGRTKEQVFQLIDEAIKLEEKRR